MLIEVQLLEELAVAGLQIGLAILQLAAGEVNLRIMREGGVSAVPAEEVAALVNEQELDRSSDRVGTSGRGGRRAGDEGVWLASQAASERGKIIQVARATAAPVGQGLLIGSSQAGVHWISEGQRSKGSRDVNSVARLGGEVAADPADAGSAEREIPVKPESPAGDISGAGLIAPAGKAPQWNEDNFGCVRPRAKVPNSGVDASAEEDVGMECECSVNGAGCTEWEQWVRSVSSELGEAITGDGGGSGASGEPKEALGDAPKTRDDAAGVGGLSARRDGHDGRLQVRREVE